MDLSNFAITTDTVTVEIKHPITDEVLYKDDGDAMTITAFLPHAKEYKAVIHAQANVRIQKAQKGKSIYTSEDIEEATLDLLIKTIKDWDIQLDGKEPKFSPDIAREVLDKFPWLRMQVIKAQDDYTSFFKV